MDTEQVRTFLAVVAHGSFLEAATRLHVTQSTVSARIQALETRLGARLFVRNRAGASLTPAGRRFVRHAKSLMLTVAQALQDVGLPRRFSASLRVGARIALWEGYLPRWVGHMRAAAPDVSIQCEIGFEEDLMRRMVEGTLDLALMYTPQHAPGLHVERLFDETLVLVSTDAAQREPDDRYVYVEWGPSFDAQHAASYPELERAALTANIGWLAVQLVLANGGSCFLPERMAAPEVAAGRLFVVSDSPRYRHPAYLVHPLDSDSPVLEPAVAALRMLAADLA
jgi:LysR family transcriptional regulator, flagellar master operon regulator